MQVRNSHSRYKDNNYFPNTKFRQLLFTKPAKPLLLEK